MDAGHGLGRQHTDSQLSERGEGRQQGFRPTERSLPIALLRARESVMEPIRDMLAQSGISEQKWRVLRVLEQYGPIEQTAISKAACLLLSSLTRLLGSMETEGLVQREAAQDDRRKSIVSITQKGRSLIDAHAEESNAIFEKLEAEFGRQRLERLLDLLEDLSSMKRAP